MNHDMTVADGIYAIPHACYSACDWRPDYKRRPVRWWLVRRDPECRIHQRRMLAAAGRKAAA